MKDKDLNEIQNHHIVPDYICKELGLTTSYKVRCGKHKRLVEFYFKENHVLVTRLKHAEIHWGYRCKDLSHLLEVCNPPQYVLDMIPLGDVRDVGAAKLLARGEIDGIDSSGENNANWGNPTNFKHSEETKKKMSETQMGKNNSFYGKKVSEEHKEKLRKLLTGVPLLEETKKKLSEANIGKVRTPEMRKHLSEVTKEQYSNGRVGNMTGKNHSSEAKKKMSESAMGRIPWNKGKTNEQIVGKEKAEKLSAAQSKRMKGHKYGVGRVQSEETKRKISEKRKSAWARKKLEKEKEKEKVTATLDKFL